MSEATKTDQTPAGGQSSATPPAGLPATTPPTPPDKAELEALKAQLAAAEAKVKKFEDEKLSDKEKADLELQRAKDDAAKIRAEALSLKLESAATRAGADYPDTVAVELRKLVGDDPDEAKIKECLQKLRKDKPGLFKQKGVDAGTSGAPVTDFNSILRGAIFGK